MQRHPSSSPDRLLLREGGGCLAWLGAPLLCTAVLIGVLLAVQSREPGFSWGRNVLPLSALVVFGFAGAVMVFGRSGFELLRGEGTVRHWQGLLRPMTSKLYALNTFDAVTLGREGLARRGRVTFQYPLYFSLKGEERLRICCNGDVIHARQLAQDLAAFTGLRFDDRSAPPGVPTPVSGGMLESLRRDGAPAALERPADARSSVERSADGRVRIVVPPQPRAVSWLPAGCAVLACAGLVSLFIPALVKLDDPFTRAAATGLVLVFFVGVPLAAGLAGVLAQRRRSFQVECDGSVLRVQHHGLYAVTGYEIACGELGEIATQTTPTGQRLYLGAGAISLVWGEHLPAAEAAWLRVELIRSLAQQTPTEPPLTR